MTEDRKLSATVTKAEAAKVYWEVRIYKNQKTKSMGEPFFVNSAKGSIEDHLLAMPEIVPGVYYCCLKEVDKDTIIDNCNVNITQEKLDSIRAKDEPMPEFVEGENQPTNDEMLLDDNFDSEDGDDDMKQVLQMYKNKAKIKQFKELAGDDEPKTDETLELVKMQLEQMRQQHEQQLALQRLEKEKSDELLRSTLEKQMEMMKSIEERKPAESTIDKLLALVIAKPDILSVFSPKKDETTSSILALMMQSQKDNMQMFLAQQKQMQEMSTKPKDDDGVTKLLLKELVESKKDNSSDKMFTMWKEVMTDKMKYDKEITEQKMELEKEKLEHSYGDPMERKKNFYMEVIGGAANMLKEVVVAAKTNNLNPSGQQQQVVPGITQADSENIIKSIKSSLDANDNAQIILEKLVNEFTLPKVKCYFAIKEIASLCVEKGGVLKELLDLVSLR